MQQLSELVCAALRSIDELEYCLVRLPIVFPPQVEGSDIDIFCRDHVNVLDSLHQQLAMDLSTSNSEHLVVHRLSKNHVHLDVKRNKRILVRFDLYSALPEFESLQLSPTLFEAVLRSRREMAIENSNGCRIWVPSPPMDSVLRLCEYCEYYWCGPDKIQHLDYLIAISDGDKSEMLRTLHAFTRLPHQPHPITRSKLVRRIRRRGKLRRIARSLLSTRCGVRFRSTAVGTRLERVARSR